MSTRALGCAAVLLLVAAAVGGMEGRAWAQAAGATDADLDCLIEPRAVIKVGSPVEGILEEVRVDRGDIVTRGNVLARLESDLEETEVMVARARAESDVAVGSARARLDYQQARKARIIRMHEQGVVSTEERDEVETEVIVAEYAVRAAEMDKRLEKLELLRVSEVLKKRTILSPVDGVVVERSMSPGEYAYAESPVMTIAEIHPLYVEVFVPLELYGKVMVGTRAEVRPMAPVGGVYNATVAVVDRVFDAASGTFGVRLELPTRNSALPGGLRCQIRFSSE